MFSGGLYPSINSKTFVGKGSSLLIKDEENIFFQSGLYDFKIHKKYAKSFEQQSLYGKCMTKA